MQKKIFSENVDAGKNFDRKSRLNLNFLPDELDAKKFFSGGDNAEKNFVLQNKNGFFSPLKRLMDGMGYAKQCIYCIKIILRSY